MDPRLQALGVMAFMYVIIGTVLKLWDRHDRKEKP